MPQATNVAGAPSDVLTPEDVERDYQIKRGTQGAMRSRGEIPFLKLGGGRLVRYRRSEIEAWLNARSVPASAKLIENFRAAFDGLRFLHANDPAGAERIRRIVETELVALTQPASLTEKAEQ